MIRYTLKCDNDHRFDSWFSSAEDFDRLKAAGHVSCPECGDSAVEKSLMAPGVRTARKAAEPEPALSQPATEAEAALAKLKAEVESNSDYVGMNFAAEARAMHDGDVPLRSIYGEAKPAEAKALIEEGVPVAPLPFTPTRKAN